MYAVAGLEDSATATQLRDAFDAVEDNRASQPADVLSENYPEAWVSHMRSYGDLERSQVLYMKHYLLSSQAWKHFIQDLSTDPANVMLFRIRGIRAPWVMLRQHPKGHAAGHPRIQVPAREDTGGDPIWMMPQSVFIKEYVDSEYPLDKVDKESEETDDTEQQDTD